MIKKLICAGILAGAALTGAAQAQDALVVSTWGGSFRDLIDENIGREFTRQTGVPVKYITGGTIDRLNKAKLATKPESDITFTTSHIGWLYVNAGLYEKLDLSKIPNTRTWSTAPRSARTTSAAGPTCTPSATVPTWFPPASPSTAGTISGTRH